MQNLSLAQFIFLNDAMALRYLVDLALHLEKNWDNIQVHHGVIKHLSECLESLSERATANLKQLAKLAPKISADMTLKHLLGIMVPIERQYTRGIRDDDFLSINEGDSFTCQPATENKPLYIVLDNIRSAFNVGSIFRTAECLGISEILLCGYTSTPEDAKTIKTAMGCDKFVPWRWFERTESALDHLAAHNIPVIAVETVTDSTPHCDFDYPKPCALLLGNERHGIEKPLLKKCSAIVHIPVYGCKNSLNVGVALGICGYEINRQWELPKPLSFKKPIR